MIGLNVLERQVRPSRSFRGKGRINVQDDSYGIWTVVHPVGEIDLAKADELPATLLEALDQTGTTT